MEVVRNCVTVAYISTVTLVWFPMEKMHLWLCCVTVKLSNTGNFEPIDQYNSGMEATNMLCGPADFVKRKEWRRVESLHEVKDMGWLNLFQTGEVAPQ